MNTLDISHSLIVNNGQRRQKLEERFASTEFKFH